MQAKFGTGTVVYKNGKWLWVGYYKDEHGKIKRPTRTFSTEAEALKFQAEQLSKSTVSEEIKTQDITVEDVYRLWLKETDVSETSKRATIYNFNKHIIPQIGKNKIKDISVGYFMNYLAELDLSDKTKYNIFTDLKTIINFGIKKKMIFKNPLDDVEPPKQPKRKRIVNNLSMEDYNKIMMNAENQKSFYYNCILFLGETGLRVSELAIREDDLETVKLGEEEIHLVYLDKTIKRTYNVFTEKSKLEIIEQMKTEDSSRIIYLNGFAWSAVQNQLDWKRQNKVKSDFIFTTSVGTLLEQRNVLRTFHGFCENAGVDKKGLHSLRKCFINRTLQNGVSPFDLAKFTGHSVQTMFKYYHDLSLSTGLKIIEASENR